ncbi:MAG TPA: ankyrin repeat domain-containing protein [Terriglobus sp.]
MSDDRVLPHQERIEEPTFRRAVYLIDSGDAAGLSRLLEEHPNLIHQRVTFDGGGYFATPSLIEFVAENPVRHGSLPNNIVGITAILLRAEPERDAVNSALGLVASGRVARECGVQLPLLKLLCEHGADPGTALEAAALHGEFAAIRALIALGGIQTLSIFAALGDTEGLRTQFPFADTHERQMALALAAQFGHAEVVKALLDTGVAPNYWGPGHAHSTPLHQAALGGHLVAIELLVAHGADAGVRDRIWNGTPADWAHHAGHREVESYLRSLHISG